MQFSHFPTLRRLPLLAFWIVLAWGNQSQAMDPKFELDPSALGGKGAATPSSSHRQKGERHPGEGVGKRLKHKPAVPAGDKVVSYTVQPGDYIYRVLYREFGWSGARADSAVRRIKELNHLADIRKLQTGSKLLIPVGSGSTGGARTSAPSGFAGQKQRHLAEAPEDGYRMVFSKIGREGDGDGVREARDAWSRIIPPAVGSGSDRFDYRSQAFSLSLDPERYPTLPAQDGSTILVDGDGSLPPLVRSLIQEKDPKITIVSGDPANRLGFYRSLLSAAHFYSFEEDFSVDFGSDPQITVRADFKIEKTPDSLLRQDVTLLDVAQNRPATPDGLVKLLAGSGFKLVEVGAQRYQRASGGAADLLYQVREKEPAKILDRFLDALAVPVESAKTIDLYAGDNIGVRLDVPVDRYFEDNGRRYAVAVFNGDPVTYTLVRLLETKGYRVIMLQAGDDFHSIADKVLSCLHIQGRYGKYDLWSAREVGYGVRMSGAMIRDNRNGDRNLFVTDRDLDPLVEELTDLNGYRLLGRR